MADPKQIEKFNSWTTSLDKPPSDVELSADDVSKNLQEFETLFDAKLNHDFKHLKRKRGLKYGFSIALFLLVVGWLIFVGNVVWNVGNGGLTLTPSIVIALITSTTATVLGLFGGVTLWLFRDA